MDIEIISSYYGVISRISDPSYHISVIDENGRLQENVWKEMCRRTANNGATGMREMPFWLEKVEDYRFAPYVFANGVYNLDRFNPLYFENLRRIVEIANLYNLKFYFSIYDDCNIRTRNNLAQFVPWTNCVQRLRHAWYLKDADPFRNAWEEKIVRETLVNLNVGYELCNEPLNKDFEYQGFKTYEHLVQMGVSDRDIVMGVAWETEEYRAFRDNFLEDEKKYGEKWWDKQKNVWLSTVHNLDDDVFNKLSEQEGHTRRFWLSVDGIQPKPDKNWWKDRLTKFFNVVPTAPFKNNYAFETMHKNDRDDFDDVCGIVDAVYQHINTYPPNYEKYPKGKDPDNIIILPEKNKGPKPY